MIEPRIYPFEIIKEQGFDFDRFPLVTIAKRGKNKLEYLRACCGFDIETTNIYEDKTAFMYIWQFAINDVIVIGRTWEEFIDMVELLKRQYKLSASRRIIIWIHNLGFEFQFLRHYFNITKIFAKEVRKPLYAIIDGCIELRDSASVSGGSLEQLAKDFTETQKMVGDLDYSIQRNNKTTKLTREELQYCINDVVILSEFADYIFTEYGEKDRYIPLTKTGILRKQIKKGVGYDAKNQIFACYPENHQLYTDMMKWLFVGGYVHANITFCDKIIDNVAGYDLTSSYPAHMQPYIGYYPVTPFLRVDPLRWREYLSKKCCIMVLKFKNVKTKFAHTIISKSKCIYLSSDAIIDNGRVLSCSETVLMFTELDFDIFEKFHSYESVECSSLRISTRGRLPRYILDVLNHAYIQKDILKKNGKNNTSEYAQYKSYVNSAYGCLVTRLSEREIILDNNGEWDYDTTQFNYEAERKKAFLLPQWGCWCTSHARYTLLDMVYKIECERARYGGDVIYCDTDSIKLINYEKHKHLFTEYNQKTAEKMKKVCEEYNLPTEHFNDLGAFDLEYTNAKMKTLGAKRYLTQYQDGKITVTIAGLPKNSLQTYCKNNNKNIFEVFNDGMLMNIDVAMKNASCYNDEPTTAIIDGVEMREESSICIYPIEFTMKVSEVYKNMIENIKRSDEKYEERIY